MKRIFCFIIIMVAFSDAIIAQPIPKRDKTKDKSAIIVPQNTTSNKIVSPPKKQSKNETKVKTKKRRQKVRIAPKVPVVASYLKVDQQNYIYKSVVSYGEIINYSVNTDGKEWSVINAPSWCKVTKHTNSFALSVEPNTYHDNRKCCITVKSDNNEVCIDIMQIGAPLYITAFFDYARLIHNNFINIGGTTGYTECLQIKANVRIKGAKGEKCMVVACIFDNKNEAIKASYGYSNYGMPSSNDVYATAEVIPSSDNEETHSVNIILPNNAMDLLKKRNKLHCRLKVYCVKTQKYINSTDYTIDFRANRRKGNVITKKM